MSAGLARRSYVYRKLSYVKESYVKLSGVKGVFYVNLPRAARDHWGGSQLFKSALKFCVMSA